MSSVITLGVALLVIGIFNIGLTVSYHVEEMEQLKIIKGYVADILQSDRLQITSSRRLESAIMELGKFR